MYRFRVSTVLRVPKRKSNWIVISGWILLKGERLGGRGVRVEEEGAEAFSWQDFFDAQTKENSQGRVAYWNLIKCLTYFCLWIHQNHFKNNNSPYLLRMLLLGEVLVKIYFSVFEINLKEMSPLVIGLNDISKWIWPVE